MDAKIKILILCLLSVFTLQAQTPHLTFAARFQITSATGGDPYNIVGIVSDDLSRFTGSDVAINDSIYVIDGSDVYVLAVTSITSVVGPTVTLVANDPLDAGVSIPTGQAAILRPTNNYTLPVYISGLRDDLRSMIMNRQAQLIDEITGGGLSITDFISAGVAVPPSAPANLNGGETWRNGTTGELWASDGVKWYPFNYGPKECVDTVTVSLITVQSGGSVTTGSPLVKNTSGVWEHMYNHPSGLNLIPDGIITDVITGPRAIIQYCGIRKGSGATPNTSYYVDQSQSTGFTTTKPGTNIRPLGKVASNGDFLVNAGLLFVRDNDTNLGNSDQTLTGNRTVTMSTNTLTFSGPLKVGGTMNVGHGNGNLSTSVAAGDSTLELATVGQNVAVGGSALKRIGASGGNVAVGYYAFNNLLGPGSAFPLTTSNFGTAIGYYAAAKPKYSFDMTAVGYAAMRSCDSCNFSTAIGYSSLANSIRSTGMTALGWASAANVRYGDVGTFLGYSAGRYAKSSLEDVVIGYEAMEGGSGALDSTITQGNTIAGYRSGRAAVNYLRNSLFGWRAGDGLTNGQWNTVIGANAAGTTALFDRCVVIGANVPISSGAYGQILIGNGSGDIKFKSDAGVVTLYDPIKFNSYGTGARTGTAAYTLAVTSAGNIIETTVAAAVSEPTNQVVYGTGTGVDSDAGFTYNAATNRLATNGYLEIGNSPDARIVLPNNDRVIAMDGTYGYLYAPNNQAAILAGLTATDPTNYYRNGSHKFQTTAGSNYAVIGSTGMSVNNGPTVRGALDVVGFDTTTVGYSMLVNNSASNDAFAIKNNGNIGVGLTAPTAFLHLRAGTTTKAPLKFNSATVLGTPQMGAFEYDGTRAYLTNSSAVRQTFAFLSDLGSPWQLAGNSVTAGTQFLGSTNNVSLRFRTNNIQRVLIDSTGNVGIANNAPTEKLDVTGNVKFSGALMPNNTAGTSGQVLTSAGAGVVPTWTTNTSESTSIGSFNNTGTSNGLSLSGTALSLHAATISTPGAVSTGQQTFTSGAGSKYFNGTGTAQISVDGNTDATEAGINFTQVGGADIMAQMQVNSSDVDNARFQLLIEDAGSYVPKLIIGSLNDQKGVQESGGLYEEVTNVTSSPYAVIYGDRNIYLDGATITVNLQAIGTSTGETKIGRVIYFFNDNATNVTITPNGSETIADAALLTLLPNTGVTLLAVTGTQWAIRD